jgi:dTDP-glucose pyrophosphorylase
MNELLVKQISISCNETILNALKQMDAIKRKLLLVVSEEGFFYGLLSIGDIQRAIINNIALDAHISHILRTDIKIAHVSDDVEAIKGYMKERRNEFMPILGETNTIVDVIFWEDLFKKELIKEQKRLGLPVVIMAGGEGSRLRPLTNVLPKPLIPIGGQTILEDIMDRFVDCGCNDFYLSVNYKAETIKSYFNNLNKPQYHISYFQEDKPLGTAGSLHLLKDKIHSTFFVSNCDIVIDEDYANILDYHKDSHNEITIVAAIKNYSVPYGTLETCAGGQLKSIHERPIYNFKINTGMYILEPHLLKEMPQNEFYHITSLIDKLCKGKRNVGVFPISEGSWVDIGNWDGYLRLIKKGEK